MTNAIKLTLEDGTTYEVGETVEWWYSGIENWGQRTLCAKDTDKGLYIGILLVNPDRVRKLQPRTTRKMNDAEFLALLRKHGAGIEVKDKYGAWHNGARYYIQPNKNLSVNGFTVIGLTHYRTSDDGYTAEHELTVEVER